MPLISVCIPIYGVEKYIERCARNLFEQTMHEGIEFIFVNDCTKDKSIEILENILSEYPERKAQTKIIHHKTNEGLVAARNTALQHVSGDYIIHCDSDDWVDKDFYESLYAKAVETNADVICAPYIVEYDKHEKSSVKTSPDIHKNVYGYIQKNIGQHLNTLWSKMYKKEIALAHSLYCPPSISMGEDLLRNVQMLDNCQSIAFVSDTYYHYWQNSTSITHSFAEKHFLNLRGILDILEEKYPCKYFNVQKHVKLTLFLATLRNLHKESRLRPLFDEAWEETSFREKLAMIFSRNCTLKGRAILTATCISRTLTMRLLRYLYRKECH